MLKETSFRDEDKTAQKKSSVHYALEPTLRLQLHRRSSANIFEFTFFDKDFAVLPTQDIILDLVRGPHLLGVIIAMGAAIYYDLRSLHRIFQPLSATDIEEVRRIHIIVATGFTAIWMTGLGLLWIRTGFDVASFSPKLWCKLIIVTLLSANAIVLAFWLLPMLRTNIGTRLLDLPNRVILMMSTVAGVSISSWLLALTLGFSTTLKTAKWDVLLPILTTGVLAGVIGVTCFIFGLRAWDQRVQHIT